jgi:hypothetical protein
MTRRAGDFRSVGGSVGRPAVGVAVHRAPMSVLAAIHVRCPELGLRGRAAGGRSHVPLDSDCISEIHVHPGGQHLPLKAAHVGERGGHEPKRLRHPLRPGIDKPAGGEKRHRVRRRPQGKIRFWIPIVKARWASMKRGRKSRSKSSRSPINRPPSQSRNIVDSSPLVPHRADVHTVRQRPGTHAVERSGTNRLPAQIPTVCWLAASLDRDPDRRDEFVEAKARKPTFSETVRCRDPAAAHSIAELRTGSGPLRARCRHDDGRAMRRRRFARAIRALAPVCL